MVECRLDSQEGGNTFQRIKKQPCLDSLNGRKRIKIAPITLVMFLIAMINYAIAAHINSSRHQEQTQLNFWVYRETTGLHAIVECLQCIMFPYKHKIGLTNI